MQTVVVPEIEELTAEEATRLLSARVSDRLGISLDEFLANLDGGVYDGEESRDILRLVTLSHFVR